MFFREILLSLTLAASTAHSATLDLNGQTYERVEHGDFIDLPLGEITEFYVYRELCTDKPGDKCIIPSDYYVEPYVDVDHERLSYNYEVRYSSTGINLFASGQYRPALDVDRFEDAQIGDEVVVAWATLELLRLISDPDRGGLFYDQFNGSELLLNGNVVAASSTDATDATDDGSVAAVPLPASGLLLSAALLLGAARRFK